MLVGLPAIFPRLKVRGLTINCFEKPREYEKQSDGEVILRVTGRGVRRGFAQPSDCMQRGTDIPSIARYVRI